MSAPDIVVQLAASVSGIPMKWREEDNYFVIIMTDGRKYRFPKDRASEPQASIAHPGAKRRQENQGKPRAQETVEDYKPPVDVTPNPEKRHRKKAQE